MSKILSRELSTTYELQLLFSATYDDAEKIELMLQDMPEIEYAMWDESGGKYRVSLQSESINDIEACEAGLMKVIEGEK